MLTMQAGWVGWFDGDNNATLVVVKFPQQSKEYVVMVYMQYISDIGYISLLA